MIYTYRVEKTQKENSMIQPTNIQQPYPAQGGANAVSINIYNPQAYGSAAPQNAQQAPYDYTNSLYNVPQASLYQPQATNPIAYLPPQPQAASFAPTQQIAPAPQVMPDSVLNQQNVQPEAPAAEAQQPSQDDIDTNALIEGLNNTDAKVREATINEIAKEAQKNPSAKQKLVAEPIMQGLVNIINEDTTKLEGPTDEQIAVAEKIVKGEKLTPEEEKISDNLAPRDAANLNRAYSLYTLAMLQKLQRDEVDEYIQNQKANGQEAIDPLKLEDLYGYNDVVNVIQNDARPEVQIAAMQALRYIARPEDKEAVAKVLEKPLASQDADVKKTAQEIMDEMPKDEAKAEGKKAA